MRSYTVNDATPARWPRLVFWFVWWLASLAAGPLTAQSDDEFFPPRPEPAVYVHDYAGWLTPDEKTRLEQKLVRYFDTTSTQIVVMIRPDIGDYTKSTYAFELGNRWGIGRKSKDNGIVMFIKSQPPDRGIFIATGYGTEGALPDVAAGRIIREVMAPYFREERYYEGIDAGTTAVIQALAGEFQADEGSEAVEVPGWVFLLILLTLFGLIVFLAWRFRNTTVVDQRGSRSRRGGDWWGGPWIGGGGSGGWGGGGGGGGGWGGGGGSFGGGSFGGGGAGGDW